MAENKKSFLLYADLINIVKKLPKETQADLFVTILEYVNDENPNPTDLLLQVAFEPVKLQLKRDLKHWDEIIEKRSINGKLGGIRSAEVRKKQKEELEAKASNGSKIQANQAVTVNDTVIVTEKEKKNLPPNFFYIGTELYKVPISTYLMIEQEETINAWAMKNKEIEVKTILDTMDKDVGKTYGDANHPFNYFKSVAKQLLKEKTEFKKPDHPSKMNFKLRSQQ